MVETAAKSQFLDVGLSIKHVASLWVPTGVFSLLVIHELSMFRSSFYYRKFPVRYYLVLATVFVVIKNPF